MSEGQLGLKGDAPSHGETAAGGCVRNFSPEPITPSARGEGTQGGAYAAGGGGGAGH